MSDDVPYIPNTPPLVSAVRARNIARLYKGLAAGFRAEGVGSMALDAERQSAWWMAYAVALSQIPPGFVDDGEIP